MAAPDLFTTLLYAVNNLLQQHKYKAALAVVKGFRNGAVWVWMTFKQCLCMLGNKCIYIVSILMFTFIHATALLIIFHLSYLYIYIFSFLCVRILKLKVIALHIASFIHSIHWKYVNIYCSYEEGLILLYYYLFFPDMGLKFVPLTP